MIKNIQYLRCLAALLVVFAHSNLQIFGVPTKYTNIGGFGVDLFFVISGFIMPYILFGGLYTQGAAPLNGPLSFAWRRISRILPLYVIATATAVYLSSLVVSGGFNAPNNELMYAFSPSRVDLPWFIESITFTHWDRAPILGVGWSLQVEFFFYIAMTFALLMGARKLESLEVGIAGFFFLVILLGSINTTNSMAAQAFGNPLVLEFTMGMFLYRMVSSGATMPKPWAITTLVLFLPIFLYIELADVIRIIIPYLDRSVQWGFAAMLLVWAALSLESKTRYSRAMILMGDASYSLYLSHAIVAPLFIFFVGRSGLPLVMGPVIYFIALVGTCQVAGIMTHVLVEKPINEAIRGLSMVGKKRATRIA